MFRNPDELSLGSLWLYLFLVNMTTHMAHDEVLRSDGTRQNPFFSLRVLLKLYLFVCFFTSLRVFFFPVLNPFLTFVLLKELLSLKSESYNLVI